MLLYLKSFYNKFNKSNGHNNNEDILSQHATFSFQMLQAPIDFISNQNLNRIENFMLRFSSEIHFLTESV